MAEWFKAPVLKTGVRAIVPWVQIPPHPLVSFFAVEYRCANGFGQATSTAARRSLLVSGVDVSDSASVFDSHMESIVALQ